MRPAIWIPWAIVALLVSIGWLGWCDQPFCTSVGATLQTMWAGFVAQPAAAGAIVAMGALGVAVYFTP